MNPHVVNLCLLSVGIVLCLVLIIWDAVVDKRAGRPWPF
jgi:hypothetical protein